MKYVLTMMMVLTMAAPAWAEKEASACDSAVNVKVNGMVCDFCARALEKVFSKREEVSGITVDLDNSMVHVELKEGQTIDDETMKKLIADSGYDVGGIEAGSCAS